MWLDELDAMDGGTHRHDCCEVQAVRTKNVELESNLMRLRSESSMGGGRGSGMGIGAPERAVRRGKDINWTDIEHEAHHEFARSQQLPRRVYEEAEAQPRQRSPHARSVGSRSPRRSGYYGKQSTPRPTPCRRRHHG